VIEEFTGDVHILNGDGGPRRHRRHIYLQAESMRDGPALQIGIATDDGLDWEIEMELSDAAFERLIADGTVTPINNS
jgi:hypothetical protein